MYPPTIISRSRRCYAGKLYSRETSTIVRAVESARALVRPSCTGAFDTERPALLEDYKRHERDERIPAHHTFGLVDRLRILRRYASSFPRPRSERVNGGRGGRERPGSHSAHREGKTGRGTPRRGDACDGRRRDHREDTEGLLALLKGLRTHYVRRAPPGSEAPVARGQRVLIKNAAQDELLAAVRTVLRVEDRVVLSVSRGTAERLKVSERDVLSGRELEVLLLAARAMSNGRTASHLHISEGTVKRHLSNIYAKLSVSSRADAVKKALTSGLITFRDLSEPGW